MHNIDYFLDVAIAAICTFLVMYIVLSIWYIQRKIDLLERQRKDEME